MPLLPLDITKEDSPDPVTPGSILTYVIKVTNPTTAPISNITLGDVLPPEVEFVNFGPGTPPGCSLSGDTVICPLGTLTSGQTVTVTIIVEVRDTTSPNSVIVNDVTVVGPGGAVAFARATTDVVAASPTSAANFPSAGLHTPEPPDPISLLTGELFFTTPVDLRQGPLSLQRYYASRLKRDGRSAGHLGSNWLHNFEWLLTRTGDRIEVVTDRGRLIQFEKVGATWTLVGNTEVPFQLVESGPDFILGDPRTNLLRTFDGSAGRLRSIADGKGNVHTLSYRSDKLDQVTDGLGRTFTFSYDGSDHLSAVSDGTRTVRFGYTGDNLTSVTDVLGEVTTYSYDSTDPSAALLTAITRPKGNTPYTQIYDADERVASQTDALGNTFTFTYDASETAITNPLGHTSVHTHSAQGELTIWTDEATQDVSIGYGIPGRRTAITDRLGDTTTFTYHPPSGKPASLTHPDGTTTTVSYTDRLIDGITLFYPTHITYPDGTTESLVYDAVGNLLSRTDRAGNVWTFTHDNHGQVLTATNPAGGVTTLTYNPDQTLASRIDTDTGVTTYGYDGLKRLTRITHPDGAFIQLAYDLKDRLTAITDENGNTYTFEYDDNDNLVRVTNPAGHSVELVYDDLDRVIQRIDQLGHASRFAYDPLGLLASRTDRNGHTTAFTYDARRRLISITDPTGQVWHLNPDAEAVLASFSNPLGHTTTLQTDQLGRLIGLIDPLNQSTTLSRDVMRRITGITDPLARTTTFGYEARGLLTSLTAPVVGTATYQRDVLGLLHQITDFTGHLWTFDRTPMGRLAALTDPLGNTWQHVYDSRGRRSQTLYPDGDILTRTYDDASNLTRRQYDSGLDQLFTYDALNRLLSADDIALTYDARGAIINSQNPPVSFGAAYDPGNRLISVTYNNGAFTVTYTYDALNRLTRVTDSLTGTWIDFVYDNAGRLTGIVRSNGVNATFTYDAADRLTRIQDGVVLDLRYTLDAAGQIIGVERLAPLNPSSGPVASAVTFTYDAASQVSSPGYTHDPRGRLTAAPGHTFTWDGGGRLVEIDGITLTYNGLGDLVRRRDGVITTRFYYNYALGLAPIVAERDEASGQFLRFYVWTPDGRLLYLIDSASGRVFFYHFDRLGSTLALTDATGTVTDAYAYAPSGELLARQGSSPQPFTFVGRLGVRHEPAADLYHMRARYYDPRTRRFLSREPLWPALGRASGLNPYEYAAQNPLRFVDPRGTDASDTDIENLTDNQLKALLSTHPNILLGLIFLFAETEGDDLLQDRIEFTKRFGTERQRAAAVELDRRRGTRGASLAPSGPPSPQPPALSPRNFREAPRKLNNSGFQTLGLFTLPQQPFSTLGDPATPSGEAPDAPQGPGAAFGSPLTQEQREAVARGILALFGIFPDNRKNVQGSDEDDEGGGFTVTAPQGPIEHPPPSPAESGAPRVIEFLIIPDLTPKLDPNADPAIDFVPL